MIHPSRCRLTLVLMAALIAATACGKRGNPMPPFSRIPSAPAALKLKRLVDDVYISFTVPFNNIDNSPTNLARVDVYAYTARQPITGERLLDVAQVVASVPVLPPAAEEGQEPPPPTRAAAPLVGAVQGGEVSVVERLTPKAFEEVPPLTVTAARRREVEPQVPPLGAAGAVDSRLVRRPARHYFAVAIARDGHKSAPSPEAALPLEAYPPGPPTNVRARFAASGIDLDWQPPATGLHAPIQPALLPTALPARFFSGFTGPLGSGGVAVPAPVFGDLTGGSGSYGLAGETTPFVIPVPPLKARPFVDFSHPFGVQWSEIQYNLYEPVADAEPALPWQVVPPAPINTAPLATAAFTDPSLEFGVRRCYVVRALNQFGEERWEGPPTEPVCVTPRDVFPPAAPRSLAAVASARAVSLIWEPSPEIDVAGYVVLRGAPGSATLQRLTPAPIPNARYIDDSVTPGTRYTYVVVAADTAGNESVASNAVDAVVPQ